MKTKTKFTLEQIIKGYFLAVSARHLSENTIKDYAHTLRKFEGYIGANKAFDTITIQHIEGFLTSFTDLSNKTLLNYHTSLSALWTWAVRENIAAANLLHAITPPKPEHREIQPFTESEFKLLLAASPRSKAYERPGKRKSDHGLPNADRSRAILLMLLDTGLRATELMEAKIHQVDQRNHRIQVMGKGALERSVPFSPRTAQALWRYLASRPEAEPTDPLFVTSLNRSMDRGQLAKFLTALSKRAGIPDVHPHRFRHTFAIQYLRNGGDPYTLQKMLGHSTLDMVKRYLALAQIDLDKAHKRASPVDNWAV